MQGVPIMEYKYVIVDQSDPSEIRTQWEEFQGNRKVMLTMESLQKSNGLIKLRDTFNENEERMPENYVGHDTP